jgi:hypothetical protein
MKQVNATETQNDFCFRSIFKDKPRRFPTRAYAQRNDSTPTFDQRQQSDFRVSLSFNHEVLSLIASSIQQVFAMVIQCDGRLRCGARGFNAMVTWIVLPWVT